MFMCVCIYCIYTVYIYIFPCWLDNSPGFRHIQMCHGAMVRSSTWIVAVLGGWSSWHPIYITPWHHGFDDRTSVLTIDIFIITHSIIYNIYIYIIISYIFIKEHVIISCSWKFLIISYIDDDFVVSMFCLFYIVLPVLAICGGMMFHFAGDVLIRFAWTKVPIILNVYC